MCTILYIYYNIPNILCMNCHLILYFIEYMKLYIYIYISFHFYRDNRLNKEPKSEM